jgi:hypothetical protein
VQAYGDAAASVSFSRPKINAGWSWPLWGVAAGVFGMIGTMFSEQRIDEDIRGSGTAVIAELNHWNFQAGIITGLIATFAILAFAAGWQRWADRRELGENLAARLVSLSLVASAGAMIIAYGFKGSLAVYLDGGMDEGSYPAENLLMVFMINDFAPFLCWWGATFASIGIAWLALKDGLLPKWMGVVAAVLALVPIVVVGLTGLPGIPGGTASLFLIIFGLGLALRERKVAVTA